jgi:hypothetical protein
MNDRKTDETTPLAPHRPLTGPKDAGATGVSQAPPRWNPNGSTEPPNQQPSRGGSSGRSTPPAKGGGSPGSGSGSGSAGSGSGSSDSGSGSSGSGSGSGSPGSSQASPPKGSGQPIQPGPPKRQPEVKPGPPLRGPEMTPGPQPRATKPRSAASAPTDTPTEAMPRVSAPTLQPGPPPNARQRPQPAPAPAPAPTPRPAAKPKPRGRPRRARLRLVRVDPWSVMKIAFALSIALAIVTVVAVSIVWAVLGAAGVWDSINESVAVVLSDNSSDFDIRDYVGMGRVVGLTMIVAAADVILITAIATLGAFLYNLAATMLGGLEITLAEDR